MEREWKKGPPTFEGWWNCRREESPEDWTHLWRWWDGKRWSYPAEETQSAASAARDAKAIAFGNGEILWTDYWPENARVPRIDPRGAA